MSHSPLTLARLRAGPAAAGAGSAELAREAVPASVPAWRAWPPWLRLLLLGSGAVPLLLLVLWGERSWDMASARAAEQARRNAELAAEFVRGALNTHRAVLDHVATLSEGVEREGGGVAALRERLTAFNNRLDDVLRLAVFDSEGRLVAASRPQPPGLGIADRAYFRALRDGGAELQVERVTPRPDDGQDVVIVAARRPGKGFEGVLLSSIPVATFVEFFGRIASMPGAAASLLREDGRLLVRHRPEDAVSDLPPDAVRVVAGAAAGVHQATTPADGVTRIYGFARVGDLPLHALFGVPRDAVVAGWLRGMAVVTALLLLTAAACCGAVFSAWRRMQGAADRAQLAEARRRADMQQTLLRELHHRVKNSLMTVQSLIRMQDGGAEGARTLQGRVIALAQVHDLLHVSGMSSRLELSAFIRTLCTRAAFLPEDADVEIHFGLEEVEIGVEQAGPLALVVVELLTNAVKHAFADGRHGQVTVGLREEAGVAVLSVRDNGIGLPQEASRRRYSGLFLVERLVGQLRGTLEVRRAGGTEFVVTFPLRSEPSAMAA